MFVYLAGSHECRQDHTNPKAGHKQRLAAHTILRAGIDRLVYQLYGLTEDEIALVEGRA